MRLGDQITGYAAELAEYGFEAEVLDPGTTFERIGIFGMYDGNRYPIVTVGTIVGLKAQVKRWNRTGWPILVGHTQATEQEETEETQPMAESRTEEERDEEERSAELEERTERIRAMFPETMRDRIVVHGTSEMPPDYFMDVLVMEALRTFRSPASTADIVGAILRAHPEITRINYKSASTTLSALERGGHIVRVGRGKYRAPSPEPSPETPTEPQPESPDPQETAEGADIQDIILIASVLSDGSWKIAGVLTDGRTAISTREGQIWALSLERL